MKFEKKRARVYKRGQGENKYKPYFYWIFRSFICDEEHKPRSKKLTANPAIWEYEHKMFSFFVCTYKRGK